MIGYSLSCKGDNLNKNVIIYVQIVDRNTRYKEVNSVQLIKIILKYFISVRTKTNSIVCNMLDYIG